MAMTVLLADRESATREFLERHLRHAGFEIVAGPGPSPERRPDLVLAGDVSELERWCGEAPVIVLGRPEAEVDDRVHAFRRGCDDYVSRPVHYEELVERIRAVLRRSRPVQRLVVGRLEIDLHTRIVSVGATPIALSQKEYALLVRLASDPRRVFTHDELLRDLWGFGSSVRTRTLDSHVFRLRRKLRLLDAVTPYIENEWGVGYRLLGAFPAGEDPGTPVARLADVQGSEQTGSEQPRIARKGDSPPAAMLPMRRRTQC
jgi:DNA-binding response OmpR family regulator